MTIVPALALGAALFSAITTILIRQGLRKSDPYTGFWINLIVGVAGLWIVSYVIVLAFWPSLA